MVGPNFRLDSWRADPLLVSFNCQSLTEPSVEMYTCLVNKLRRPAQPHFVPLCFGQPPYPAASPIEFRIFAFKICSIPKSPSRIPGFGEAVVQIPRRCKLQPNTSGLCFGISRVKKMPKLVQKEDEYPHAKLYGFGRAPLVPNASTEDLKFAYPAVNLAFHFALLRSLRSDLISSNRDSLS